jgi:hypothetical protein
LEELLRCPNSQTKRRARRATKASATGSKTPSP